MPIPPEPEPRAVCPRCRRPASVCYCRDVTPIATRTRVVLLQHPHESEVAIGTAHMARVCLTNAELHVGVDWGDAPALARALRDPTRTPVLLYPGDGARDIVREPPPGPVTLIVVDGTWTQARQAVARNPVLAALPRYAFTPPAPSEYRIRREPDAAYVSTIEALMHVLGVLEGEPERFRALLEPFRAMVDMQIACATERPCPRPRPRRPQRPFRSRVPVELRRRVADLVCVHADANAWPYGSRERATTCPDELIHLVAHRPASGESLEVIVAPTRALAPGTCEYTGLAAGLLAAGGDAAALDARWRAFGRPTDVVCAWGSSSTQLLRAAGAWLPPGGLDLRQVARCFARGKIGTLEQCLARLGATARPPLGAGRAGRRLGQVVGVADFFVRLGRDGG
ncbi:MAG TPA: tRNA-uridine aminocarboxypropyltransferase [Polyangia bacterium]|jgi:DTW domain-containing protein YfiP